MTIYNFNQKFYLNKQKHKKLHKKQKKKRKEEAEKLRLAKIAKLLTRYVKITSAGNDFINLS